jgi:hypothetical protein
VDVSITYAQQFDDVDGESQSSLVENPSKAWSPATRICPSTRPFRSSLSQQKAARIARCMVRRMYKESRVISAVIHHELATQQNALLRDVLEHTCRAAEFAIVRPDMVKWGYLRRLVRSSVDVALHDSMGSSARTYPQILWVRLWMTDAKAPSSTFTRPQRGMRLGTEAKASRIARLASRFNLPVPSRMNPGLCTGAPVD